MPERSLAASPRRLPAVDVHAHVVVPEVFAATRPHSLFARAEAEPSLTDTQRAAIVSRNDAVVRRMADIDDRIAAMDAAGIAVQVLSPSLVHQCSDWLPPDAALALDRRTNDTVAALVATAPARFVGLGSVPLQTPHRAAAELERCIGTLGLKGVVIPTRIGEREIGDAGLRRFWARAEALGAVVHVHPAGNPDARLRPYMMWNSLGQSIEETFAIASLFYEGILDAFPDLRICISHGGGYMPFYTGRIERNYAEKPATRRNMTKPPADYLRMLHYDTCVYDARVLRHLVEVVGADRVLLGSDYPVGDPQPVAFVRDATFLTDDDKSAILAGTASRLYGIDLGP